MSKSISIRKVEDKDLVLDYKILERTFSNIEKHAIDKAPWKVQFPYIPKVNFKITYSKKYIGLYYSVQEEFVGAKAYKANENVWEDSCVEFFVSLDNKKTYYNFEFNVLGTGLIGYGPENKSERKRLDPEIIDSVDVLTIVNKEKGVKTWELFMLIPVQVITKEGEGLEGKLIHANFYKCGDALPLPHFLAWNTINNPTPNFHLPEFFGQLSFES